MTTEIKIDECFHNCPFFGSGGEMHCNHPYWKDKPAYDNMIITQNNSRDGNIPDKYPLLKEELTIIYKIGTINN